MFFLLIVLSFQVRLSLFESDIRNDVVVLSHITTRPNVFVILKERFLIREIHFGSLAPRSVGRVTSNRYNAFSLVLCKHVSPSRSPSRVDVEGP